MIVADGYDAGAVARLELGQRAVAGGMRGEHFVDRDCAFPAGFLNPGAKRRCESRKRIGVRRSESGSRREAKR